MELSRDFKLPDGLESLSAIYQDLAPMAAGLMMGQRHRIANAANLSALIYDALPDLNWVGFYFIEPDPTDGGKPVLMVGPFQGKPACVRIEIGQGVCGSAVAQVATQRVADVHAFEGHIACDPASRSELVVPLVVDGVIGVLDIDSPLPNRFSSEDQAGIEYLASLYIQSIA
jgi:L-methionine (R)-S-oxide reductase